MTSDSCKTRPDATVRTIALVCVISGILAAADAAALDKANPEDAAPEAANPEVWLIGTYNAARTGPVDLRAEEEHVNFWRLAPKQTWETARRHDFLDQTDSTAPTTIFIHGNRIGRCQAIRDGWKIYRRMRRDANGRPFRFVIWSWPAERVGRRQRPDLQLKASYSDTQAYYLAELLSHMPRDAKVSLIGYSYGARTIAGALHTLAGGQMCRRRLRDRSDEHQPPRIRAMLIAAAVAAGSFAEGCRNELALSQVDQILVTRNPCDPVLRWYPRLYGRRGPAAMGYVGTCRSADPNKLEQVNVACSVGRSHDWNVYACSPSVLGRIASYTFLEPDETAAVAVPRVASRQQPRDTKAR